MTGPTRNPPRPSRRPRVSVLLPVRDGERYLPRCLESLTAQTLAEAEFLVVDDGSRDSSREILEAWARSDDRVRVLVQPRAGLVPALERARAHARAPLLARMDADDIAHPRRLASQLALMDGNRDVVLSGCGIEYFPEERVKDGARRYQRWLNGLVAPEEIDRDVMVECPIAHPTFMMRAHAVAEVGGYRDAGWPEDYDLLLRLWEAGGRFAKVPEVLLRWRESADRLSRTDPRYGLEAFRRAKVDVLGRTLLHGRSGVLVWGAGPTGKAFARTLLEAGERVQAFVELDPRKIGQEVYGVPVVEPSGVGSFQGTFSVAAVAGSGAREEIRRTLLARGQREMIDFCAVA